MVGVIPSASTTFEVISDFNSKNLREGKLYWDPKTKILYYYSQKEQRPCPTTGYFPIWDGTRTFSSSKSKIKKYPEDVLSTDVSVLSKSIDTTLADRVRYLQRKMDQNKKLEPTITPEDNAFTQCIKGIICKLELSMTDLYDMADGKLSEHMIENYYNSLVSINMMRQEKWKVWVDTILHLTYSITVFKPPKQLLLYDSVTDKINTGVVHWDQAVSASDDPLKRITKILIQMENITKASLRRPEIDYYAVNNLFTAINSTKDLSAQLFSRFIHMANLSYTMVIYKDGKEIFVFKE